MKTNKGTKETKTKGKKNTHSLKGHVTIWGNTLIENTKAVYRVHTHISLNLFFIKYQLLTKQRRYPHAAPCNFLRSTDSEVQHQMMKLLLGSRRAEKGTWMEPVTCIS